MRRILFLLLILMFVSGFVFSQDNIIDYEKEIKGVLKQVSPSIVKVISENHNKYVATGIAIDRDLVLTSNLVIRHPYDRIYVRTVDNRRFTAKVEGNDRYSSLALLKLNEKKMVPIKTTSHLEVGDWIALVGVFYDEFPAISQGIVSSASEDELILNAPVAPGSSGGAVVNKKGELAAVIRGGFGFAVAPDLSFRDNQSEIILRGLKTKNRALCYAIPVQRVLSIASQLKEFGQIKRGWLGVYLASGGNGRGKVAVSRVAEGSPADKAGIKTGDIIISINKKEINSTDDVTRLVRTTVPGNVVKFEIQRGKKLESRLVRIGEYKQKPEYVIKDMGDFRVKVPEWRQIPEIKGILPEIENFVFFFKGTGNLGLDVRQLDKELKGSSGSVTDHGLLVRKVFENSAADKAGIKAGDIIIKANGGNIRFISDLRSALNSLKAAESLELELERDRKIKRVKVEPTRDKDEFFNWNGIKDQLKHFSIEFHENAGDSLRRGIQELHSNLAQLKMNIRRISEDELEALNQKIGQMQEKARVQYEKTLKKLLNEREQWDEELGELKRELLRLRREYRNRENESKRRQEKEKRDGAVI